jgi:hypothetical protein
MQLAPIDPSAVPRYRRIPPATPSRGPQMGLLAEAMPLPAADDSTPRRPHWLLVAFLAWEASQLAIGVYYGVKLALVVT